MIIVIDGYNVMKQVVGAGYVHEAQRRAFISLLAVYGQKKGHKIVVVFDGGESSWPHKEVVSGVTIIYSGTQDSADTYIMHYIDDHASKELLLVSSDNELNYFATRHAIVSIGSQEFYFLVKEALRESRELPPEPYIEIDESMSDIDELMNAAASHVPNKDEGCTPGDYPSKSRRESKIDRELLRKLKKL